MAVETVELGTIYLVDLVGSTQIATSVGPVRWDEMRERFFGLLREAIDACGGREFRNTGDGLMVAFATASAAVGCAVLTQQLFERRYRGAQQRLRVRIGLGTGESTVKDGEYFGMPATEAARLCDKAPADGILVSPATRLLAGRVDGARFEPFGELELKGIPEPMEAFAVVWERLADESGIHVGAWPVPAALRTVPRVAYVGRVAERELLERSSAQARGGARQAVLVSGEPGIGKTRLASYAARRADAEGFAVCWGTCSEDVAAPYEPWIEVCSQLVEHAPGDVLDGHVAAHGGEIGRLARNLARRVPDAPEPRSSDPETERLLLFTAVGELLGAVAHSQPLCVVLDDFHWADGQSVALLKHVARAVEQGALMVIVLYRDSDLTKDHSLTGVLADLRRSEGVARIRLSGLGPVEVAELVAAAAGHELDADALALAGGLATETGGNPFFIGEILRNLTESGAITFDEATGRWSVDRSALSSLPESVREVIEHRIDRLGEQVREVLTVAAVIGRSFDVALLTALVEIPESLLLDQLEAAVGATLLHESTNQVGQFTFEHTLINHTLYQGLGNTRRARVHRRVAEALEEQLGGDPGARVGELAQHWAEATTTVDLDKAVTYAAMAGERALVELAPDEALQWFGRALELLGDRDDRATRCDLLIGLGEAQRLTGDAGYRRTLLDASRVASELRDGERAARAALVNSRGQTSAYGQVDQERVAAIERALELDDDPDRRAGLLSLQAVELLYEHDHRHRRELAEQALALAREIGTPETTARVLTGWFRVFQAPDGLERRVAHLGELVAAVQAAGDPALEFWAASAERVVMVESGQLERAENVGQRMVVIAERLGEPTMRWQVAMSVRASVALLRGELAEAERCAEQALALGSDAGEPDRLMIHGAQIIFLRVLQGRAGEVVALLEQSVQANALVPAWNAALAWTLCWLGRGDEAAAIVAEAARDRFEHVPWEQTRTAALALYADAAAQAGVNDAAEILYELIEPWADQVAWNGTIACGHARTYLGLLAAALGRDEQADQDFARAIEIQERGGMLVWAARAHLGWAERLFARGQRNQARQHARRALELSREHGYGAFEPRAAALLQPRSTII